MKMGDRGVIGTVLQPWRIVILLVALAVLASCAGEGSSTPPDDPSQATGISTDEPESEDEPEELDQPESADEPEELDQPESADEPEELDQPESADEPEELDQPESEDEPEELDQPESEDEPEELDQPESADEPEELDQPESADEPEELDQPESEDEPEELDQPESEDEPEELDQPESADEPEELDQPESEDEPEELDQPESADEPEELDQPESADEPEELDQPENEDEPETVEKPENQPFVPAGEPPQPAGEFEDILVSVGGGAWPFLASGLFSDADNDVAELTYVTALSEPEVATVETVVNSEGHAAIIVTGTAVGSATLAVTATDPSGLSGEQIFNVVVDDSGFTPLPGIKVDNNKIELGDGFMTLTGTCTPPLSNTQIAQYFYTVHSMTWQTRVDSSADWVNIEGTATTDGRLCPHTANAAGDYRMVMELSVQPDEHVEPLRGYFTAANTFTATATPTPPRLVTFAELLNLVGFSQEETWLLDNLSLFDADHVYVQERTVTLPLAGDTTLIVVRETPETFRTIDAIEERVRQYEDFMNIAFPFKTLPVFISDSTYARGFFTRIYERLPPVGYVSFSPRFQEDSNLIAHETAHSYWHPPRLPWRNPPTIDGIGLIPFNWIFEGAATFLDHLAEERIHETTTIPSQSGCNLFDTIGELDQKTFNPDENLIDGLYKSGCSYTMGLGIFSALYHRLGDEEFRRGFGSLSLKILNLEHEDECTGVETGICYVRRAFVEEASPGWYGEVASEVIDQWYQVGDARPPIS